MFRRGSSNAWLTCRRFLMGADVDAALGVEIHTTTNRSAVQSCCYVHRHRVASRSRYIWLMNTSQYMLGHKKYGQKNNNGQAGEGGLIVEAERRDLDLDLEADLKAHRPPGGCSMAPQTTLHIGRPSYVMHAPWTLAGHPVREGQRPTAPASPALRHPPAPPRCTRRSGVDLSPCARLHRAEGLRASPPLRPPALGWAAGVPLPWAPARRHSRPRAAPSPPPFPPYPPTPALLGRCAR